MLWPYVDLIELASQANTVLVNGLKPEENYTPRLRQRGSDVCITMCDLNFDLYLFQRYHPSPAATITGSRGSAASGRRWWARRDVAPGPGTAGTGDSTTPDCLRPGSVASCRHRRRRRTWKQSSSLSHQRPKLATIPSF